MNSGNQYVFDCRTRSKKATGINPKYIKKFKWFESSRKWTCTQGFSLTWKLLQKNSICPDEAILNQSLQELKRESRPYVLNPKYSTPTSLPLYFYFVYQLLQESKRLEECGPVSWDLFIIIF